MRSSGYKLPEQAELRRQILAEMPIVTGHAMDIPPHLVDAATATDHLLDALLCVFAAADFLAGTVMMPPEPPPLQEGWIWNRPPRNL